MENIDLETGNRSIEVVGDLEVLSSAPLNGGLTKAHRVVNLHTSENEKGPVRDYIQGELGLSSSQVGQTVGFITAADVANAYCADADIGGHHLKVVLTAGVGDPFDSRYHRTINIIVVTDLNLSQTAMANLFIVVTEAKTDALRELDVIKNGHRITGTPTDAVAVAVAGDRRGEEIPYSGTATEIGQTAFDRVKSGVIESLERNNGYSRNRSILSRLADRGVTRVDMFKSAMGLLVGRHDRERLRDEFNESLERFADDLNVRLLLASALHLEEELERVSVSGDPGHLIADELIGIEIAEYIGGRNALFNFVRYDKEKPGVLSELPPFLDDAVGGLIAGIMTKLFAEK
ncbi:MAG: phosphatidylglycerophosphatase A [Candidatus Acetothermia bacterium]